MNIIQSKQILIVIIDGYSIALKFCYQTYKYAVVKNNLYILIPFYFSSLDFSAIEIGY